MLRHSGGHLRGLEAPPLVLCLVDDRVLETRVVASMHLFTAAANPHWPGVAASPRTTPAALLSCRGADAGAGAGARGVRQSKTLCLAQQLVRPSLTHPT